MGCPSSRGHFQQADSSIVPTAEGTASPACPLRMLDLMSFKRKEKKKRNSQHHPHPLSPSSSKNNGAPPYIPLLSQESRSLVPTVLSCSEELGYCYTADLSSDCTQEDTHSFHTPKHTALLVNSLSRCNLAATSPPPPPLHPH